ncbi:MAG: type VI secretion system secreted protein VgrG, partial [Ilumatobacter sp.]
MHKILERDMANDQQNNHHESGGNEGPTWVTRHRRWLRRAALLSAATMASTFSLIGAGPAAVQGHDGTAHEAPVDLGSASSFGALTPGEFAATGVTSFRGDIGSNSYEFNGPENHIGTSYIGDTYATATDDFLLAYGQTANDATNPDRYYPTETVDFNPGLTLGPGWHTNGTSTAATIVANATLSFDGGDHPDAVFILHVGGALTLGDGVKMVLINGAQAKNVFWHVDGSVSIGANATFVGTALAGGSIDTGANSLVNGRLLTQAGNIAMGHSSLYSGPPSVSIDGGTGDADPVTYSVADPEISGVTSAAKVTVAIDGVTQADKPVPVGGAWTLELDGPLSNGNHVVVATVADAIGNTGSATQALSIAAPLPVLSIDGGAVVNTADQTPTITGTTSAPAGQVVHFTLTRTERNPSDAPPLVLTRTAIVQASNTWNITP